MRTVHFLSFITLSLSLGVIGTGCTTNATGANEEPAEDSEDVKSGVTAKALVNANTSFATDLYGELATTDENIFFSPYSISAALGMTYAGAKKGTAAAMKGTLHFPAGNVHPAFHTLDTELAKRNHASGTRQGDGFQLSIANSLWGEKTQHFENSFLGVVRDNYGAGLELADFENKADAERVRINNWVEDKTHDKIKNLLPQGILESDTKLVLVDAIYFKASWDKAFEKTDTKTAKFSPLSGPKVDVDMMRGRRKHLKYSGDASYDAVAIPYLGGEVELVAIAPKAGKFATFEHDLDASTLEQIYKKLSPEDVDLRFPKFKIAGSSIKLKEALKKLGMGVAFTDSADLSGITGKSDTKIADVVHKAFINLDEKGTEAAAATAVIVVAKTAIRPQQPIQVTFDRPFIFAVRDVPTGTMLFLGRVTKPQGD